MPNTILGAPQLCLWPQGLFSSQDAATGSYEFGRLPKITTAPSCLFSREGTLYYIPSSGPNPRHYLPLTSLKRFALTGGSGDGDDDGDWVTP